MMALMKCQSHGTTSMSGLGQDDIRVRHTEITQKKRELRCPQAIDCYRVDRQYKIRATDYPSARDDLNTIKFKRCIECCPSTPKLCPPPCSFLSLAIAVRQPAALTTKPWRFPVRANQQSIRKYSSFHGGSRTCTARGENECTAVQIFPKRPRARFIYPTDHALFT
ncbi:hypothetical protein GQ44DRAFT_317692 [Phaeosphaeriaceae sp. PMI808]|nr:hypothetical protein GQ44DRAFT_317692 [Phaeosphaeriaceae sp. PMI808]